MSRLIKNMDIIDSFSHRFFRYLHFLMEFDPVGTGACQCPRFRQLTTAPLPPGPGSAQSPQARPRPTACSRPWRAGTACYRSDTFFRGPILSTSITRSRRCDNGSGTKSGSGPSTGRGWVRTTMQPEGRIASLIKTYPDRFGRIVPETGKIPRGYGAIAPAPIIPAQEN